MGDLYESVCSLSEVLAEEVRDAILGDDVVDVRPCRHDPGAARQEGHNRGIPVQGRRRHGEDGFALAVRGQRRGSKEVNDASHT